MRSAIWIGIFVGSTVGGFIPLIWGDDMLSYSGVLFSGIGAFVGLWIGSRAAGLAQTTKPCVAPVGLGNDHEALCWASCPALRN